MSNVLRLGFRVGLACALALALLPATFGRTLAAEPTKAEQCNGSGFALSPESVIAGCTALIEDKSTEDETRYGALNNRGNAYDIKGDLSRALVDYAAAIRLRPKAPVAYFNRGYAYFRANDMDRAIPDLDQAVRLDPTQMRPVLTRGEAYLAKARYAEAIADLDSALRLDPTSEEALEARGAAHSAKGEYDAAIADSDAEIALAPNLPAGFVDRGSSLAMLEKFDRAVADLSEAIRLDPNLLHAYRTRGAIYFQAGDYAAAVKDFEHATAMPPEGSAHVYAVMWLYLSRAHARMRNAAQGLSAEPQLAQDGEWPGPALQMLAGTLSPDELLAKAKDPDRECEARFYIGERLLLDGKREAALASLHQARTICNKNFVEYAGTVSELKRLER